MRMVYREDRYYLLGVIASCASLAVQAGAVSFSFQSLPLSVFHSSKPLDLVFPSGWYVINSGVGQGVCDKAPTHLPLVGGLALGFVVRNTTPNRWSLFTLLNNCLPRARHKMKLAHPLAQGLFHTSQI